MGRMRKPRINPRRSTRFIVKVQRPLSSNVRNPPCLIYNEDRSLQEQFPMTEQIAAMFADDDMKVYCWAHMEGTVLHLDERAEDQNW